MADAETILCTTIASLGARGDGVAFIEGSKLHIPFALPGETAHIQRRGQRGDLVSIERQSAERVRPICRHFGTCGGCSLQHWNSENYAAWKASLIESALSSARLDTPLEPLNQYPVASRRRATFTARKAGESVQLGYNAARSHDLVHLSECPVLLPSIVAMLPHLQEALAVGLSPRGEARIHVTAAENGIDCSIEGAEPARQTRPNLAAIFSKAGVIRALWNGEIIHFASLPCVSFGGIPVALPPGAFLQAVEACERDMAAFVAEALHAAKVKGPVCDLFAGLGAFSFPCARFAAVTAYEAKEGASDAMQAAARSAKGIKPVQVIRRDLYRHPLSALELNRFEAAIVDPPREGAETQCRTLAASKIRTVAMLSCNPATFARDAAHLTSGGFELMRVAAFDQFRFSAHVELAAAFQRRLPRASKKGGS